MDVDFPKVVAGFVGTALVLGGLVYVVGISDLVGAIRLLEARSLALIAVAGLAWLVAWGFALRTVLATLGVETTIRGAQLLYASAAFANNVTPFGQAGGEPISALLIARATGTEYERGLAAIASVDSLNFVPSIVLALLGLAYYVARFTVGDRILFVVAVVVGLALAVPAVAYLGWRSRERIKATVTRYATPLLQRLGVHLPGVPVVESVHVRERIGSFYAAIGRVATDRRQLATAMGFSALGWLFLCVTLYLTLYALGAPVSPVIVAIVVPVGTIASIAPLPGGAGGVEAATVLLLVPTTGVSAATAGAAAIVYRVSTYWIPTILGGVAASWLQGHSGP
ncbi:MAG: YbhN family protein [Halanaeroarchaeum sp.]